MSGRPSELHPRQSVVRVCCMKLVGKTPPNRISGERTAGYQSKAGWDDKSRLVGNRTTGEMFGKWELIGTSCFIYSLTYQVYFFSPYFTNTLLSDNLVKGT